MQDVFLDDELNINPLVETISKPRLTRYLIEANGNTVHALSLYYWNCRLSQALYLPLQTWEISLRNRINRFLIWKFGQKWFEDQRALRAFGRGENEKLSKTILRQHQNRGSLLTADQVVADLSAGFWVGTLSKRYDIPFVWRYNLTGQVFKNDATITRDQAFRMCGDLLNLRNRVAHHEPIFHLDLVQVRSDLDRILNGLCGPTQAQATSACSFSNVWAARPQAGLNQTVA